MGTKFINRVFKTKSVEGQREIYDEWAATYEAEVFANGYRTPAVIASVFTRFIAPDAGPILDAGCGGGLQTEPLALLGYGPFTGIDLSDGMLSVARAKGIYAELQAMPLDESIPFEDDQFAAVISAGVLSPGQAPASSLRALARVTKPGGTCVFSLRGGDRTSPEYHDVCDALVDEGVWRKLFTSGPFQVMPVAEPDGLHEVLAYRIA